MPRKILIIGAHAAGVDAASAARKTDRKAEITLLTTEKNAGYSRCGLPFVLGRQIENFGNLIVFPPSFYQMMKLNLKKETTATSINTDNKTVDTIDSSGKAETLPYDTLIITTGARAFIPPIPGREKEGVHSLRSIEDGQGIDKAVKNGARTAAVVGAGLIGLEAAVALRERGLDTTVVELLPQVLPVMLDKDLAGQVQEYLEKKELKIVVGKSVDEILGTEKVKAVSIAGEEIPADIVVIATGIRANTDLATKAGIETGSTRTIKTNAQMETNVKDIFTAGDCAESTNIITKKPACPQLGTVAVRHGKVAGVNAAGGYSLFTGVLGSAVTQLFDTQIGVTGLTEFFAKREGIETVTGTITSKTRADYYPGGKALRVKLLAEKESQRIIGGQFIGGEEVTQRVNALSFAIQKQMTVRELAKTDTAYAPPLNETWEPMVLAAEVALMKLRGR
ncbi:MAG: FAD-dependent oxidoreductase [Candidatus Bathyarchaeota archaeon]|nr:MAG: FAD-dependent oxidoreductase [Candidatus Bathyarchaeota archaeon]